MICCILVFFVVCCFFKQKTAYEMRISDWSSDVCSSDLHAGHDRQHIEIAGERLADEAGGGAEGDENRGEAEHEADGGADELPRGLGVAALVLQLVEGE